MGFLVFVLCFILFIWLWPYLRAWMQRRFRRKMEDMMRRAMGMPPREEKSTWQKVKEKFTGSEDNEETPRETRRRGRTSKNRKIPPEYAVDVEFVEIKEYTETTTLHHDGVTYTEERQVVDAEWTEIRETRDER